MRFFKPPFLSLGFTQGRSPRGAPAVAGDATVSRPTPRLSIVAASRNDDHGGDPLVRTQIFINAFAFLAERHRVPIEIVMVDWNPVPDRPGLAGVLQLPIGATMTTGRVITVPAELHRRFKYSDQLGFFQMIAKNVGIRRARGRFILATNIDILFSEALFLFMTSDALRADRHYRVDRIDVAANLPANSSLDAILAHTETAPIRTHRRFSPAPLVAAMAGAAATGNTAAARESSLPDHLKWTDLPHGFGLEVDRTAPPSDLHTNGCGDFALMSQLAWHAQRGYPEFEAFSFNIDSIGLMQSHYGGTTEISLLPPYAAFHIEHSIGSGWTPEGEKKLFERLESRRILNPEWRFLNPLVDELREHSGLTLMNRESWGMAAFDLPEEPLLVGRCFNSPPHPRAPRTWPDAPVCALLPEYDLDRRALWHEREQQRSQASGAAFAPASSAKSQGAHQVQLFWPDAAGVHSEADSTIVVSDLRGPRRLFFAVPALSAGAVLRLDPTFLEGIVEITALELQSAADGRTLWSSRTAPGSIQIGGTCRLLGEPNQNSAMRLLVDGNDPQLYLPPLPEASDGPLLFFAELAFFPLARG